MQYKRDNQRFTTDRVDIIKANPGWAVVYVNKEEAGLRYDTYPIIAWALRLRIDRYAQDTAYALNPDSGVSIDSEPIMSDGDRHDYDGILRPDGLVEVTGVELFDSVESFVKSVKKNK